MSFGGGAEEQSQKKERKSGGEAGRRGKGEEKRKNFEFGPYYLEKHTMHRMEVETLGIFSHSKKLK